MELEEMIQPVLVNIEGESGFVNYTTPHITEKPKLLREMSPKEFGINCIGRRKHFKRG